jgi:cytochrome c-type biogenesis protein CcmF
MAILGNIALVLALLAALYTGVAFILSLRLKVNWLAQSARWGVWGVAGFTTLAVLLLLTALVTHNFSLQYVASYSSLETSFVYLVTGLWAGNAGSILFWGWLIALAGAILLWREKKNSKELLPYAFPVIMLTEILFLVLLFIHNPFARAATIPTDGIGLNPLLENAGMIFHPPILLAGFALFVIPFSLAIAALISKKLGNGWLVSAKSWALAAWLLLGAGNILGMWWAYAELGWGGYWAWDPVENAGLMPWLLVTAFLHSTMMQRRRGLLKSWSLLLIIFAFNLTIFGAFLTRSDILNSVHSFGSTAMGPVFIIFLAIVLIGSLVLVFLRRKDIKEEPGDDAFVSGENTFLFNNLLLVAATFAVFIGTMFPFFTEIFTGNRMEIDISFFNQVNIPIFLVIILLAGLCVFVGWRKPDLRQLGKVLLWPAVAAVVLIILLVILGRREWYVLTASFILAFVFSATLFKWWRDVASRQNAKKEGYFNACMALFKANRSRYGGYLIHLSVVIMALGIMGSSVYDESKQVVMAIGDSVEIKGYTLTYNGLMPYSTPTRMTITADIDVSRGDKIIDKLRPVKWFQMVQEQVVTEVSIRSTLAEDLYVSLDDWDDTQNAAFTILVNPLVSWIWIGGFVLLVGGLVSFSAPPRKELVEE